MNLDSRVRVSFMSCLKNVLLEHVTLLYVITSEQCDKHIDSILSMLYI